MTNVQRPLVTLALVAYNQERFVGEAIASLLAQDYSPLEIILSDDFSTDGTFEVIQQAALNYCGPHKIMLNRNSKNLHIGGHINTVNRLANGELIVVAAGDDMSVPHRVSALVGAWLESGKSAGVLHSACTHITEDGKFIREFTCPCLSDLETLEQAARNPAFVIGATEAWSKDIFCKFGDLRLEIVHEDHALGFRSLLAGKPIIYVAQSLVCYRQGSGISTVYGSKYVKPQDRRTMLGRYWMDTQQKLDDLKVSPNTSIERIVQDEANRYKVALRFEDGFPGVKEWMSMVRLVGFSYVARMTLKFAKNHYIDQRVTVN